MILISISNLLSAYKHIILPKSDYILSFLHTEYTLTHATPTHIHTHTHTHTKQFQLTSISLIFFKQKCASLNKRYVLHNKNSVIGLPSFSITKLSRRRIDDKAFSCAKLEMFVELNIRA